MLADVLGARTRSLITTALALYVGAYRVPRENDNKKIASRFSHVCGAPRCPDSIFLETTCTHLSCKKNLESIGRLIKKPEFFKVYNMRRKIGR